MNSGLQMGAEEDREVKDKVREALRLMEMNGESGF